MRFDQVIWICEGATGCAAGLSLGLGVIGRPSCSGGTLELLVALPRLKARHCVIIADSDNDREFGGKIINPGLDGAQRLADVIGIPCCMVILPCKDIREFVRIGGTAQDLEDIVKSSVWKVH